MSDPDGPKTRLRAELLARRTSLPEDRRSAAAELVCERLLKVPEVALGRVIAAFSPTGSEIDITPALQALLADGRVLALPWVEGAELHLGAVTDLAVDLAPGWRGVAEPAHGARRPLAVEDVDCVIAPGLGFDRRGHRLGYGGGHYDRLLARRRAGVPAVAVGFAEQVLDAVPAAAHDIPVDVVVTDVEVIRCREP